MGFPERFASHKKLGEAWIDWTGGEPPHDGATRVDILTCDGRRVNDWNVGEITWVGEYKPVAYRLHSPVADADGWIEWKGGECPVAADTIIYVKAGDHAFSKPDRADSWNWNDFGHISAYRLAQPAKELPVTMEEETSASALQSQVAGDHYRSMKIQPIEYIHANGIGFSEGTAIAYLSRWREKGGLEDLRKAVHTIELLIELESKVAK